MSRPYSILLFGGTGQATVIHSIIVNDEEEYGNPSFQIIDEYGNKPKFPCDFYKTIEEWDRKKRKVFIMLGGFVVTIGNPNAKRRIELSELFEQKYNISPLTVQHKSAIVFSLLGKGTQIHPGVIVNEQAKVGDWNILNTGCLVEHNCILEDGVEIGPRAVLCGNVKVGKHTWIGANATVRQNINIGADSIVGAGSVALKDIPDGEIWVGNPARFLRKNKY